MEAIYLIPRYLKGFPGKGVFYSSYRHLRVEAYIDADWAGSVTDRRFTSVYCTFVGGNLVTWKSKKHVVVTIYCVEAKFRSMAHGVCEFLWLKMLLAELGFPVTHPMGLYCNNKAVINIAHNPVQHDRTKHVEVDRYFIKEQLQCGSICTPLVKIGDQLVNVLTKGLPSTRFIDVVGNLEMRDIYFPA